MLASTERDPLLFVQTMFPWGEPGDLEHETIDAWQRGVLEAIRDGLITIEHAIQIAIASGHGVGKSCLVAWIILWAMSTLEDTRGVVTANTESQLKTKTWAEVGKWYRLFIGRHLFKLTATALMSVDPERERTWRIDMVAWSEKNQEAFAGLHNRGKRIILVFDEASAIPTSIWETSEGALTDPDTQIIWLVCGNPTRVDGRFRECFTKFRHRWHHVQVDGRTAKTTDKALIDRWIADYGIDSDFVRIRVLGLFPRASANQFISTELIEAAAARYDMVVADDSSPLIFGVDIARFGDDQTVILARQGRKVPWIKAYRGIDTVQIVTILIDLMDTFHPDAVNIDAGGGAGVIDVLKSMGRDNVHEVAFGAAAREPKKYFNARAQMYGDTRDWLETGAIPPDQELQDDLAAPLYGFAGPEAAIQLERKADMKKRGLPSPDKGDALVLTHARKGVLQQRMRAQVRKRRAAPTSSWRGLDH